MKAWTRRDLIKAPAVAGTLACSGLRGAAQGAEEPGATALRPRLPRGYLLVQEVGTYHASRFGCISTAAEAREVFAPLAGRVDGVEFSSAFFDVHDVRAHEEVAKVGAARRVDLWISTFRMAFKVRSFGAIRPEFQARVMEADGRIVPAERAMDGGGKAVPLLDVLNPEAVDWFLGEFRQRYCEPMKGLLAGLFFNEDCLPYLAEPVNYRRYDYWRNATFSARVLELWREHCREHEVLHEGRLVDRFPVHDARMVAGAGEAALHVPGWNVPAELEAGQAFVDLPRVDGVWKHWTDFTCELFLNNWIGRLAQVANEVNRGVSGWKGVLYFGLHHWSLPYEEIANPEFRVPQAHRWGAWGRQRGVDLKQLAAHPEVDGVICETYPPISAHLPEYVAEYERITREAGKTFGVMLHRDDRWALKREEEERRWELIEACQPTVIARYPRQRMLPGDEFYRAEVEELFAARLARYRKPA